MNNVSSCLEVVNDNLVVIIQRYKDIMTKKLQISTTYFNVVVLLCVQNQKIWVL